MKLGTTIQTCSENFHFSKIIYIMENSEKVTPHKVESQLYIKTKLRLSRK